MFPPSLLRTRPDLRKFPLRKRCGADSGQHRELQCQDRSRQKAQLTDDFMIIARIESLILERGMEDALNRARAFVAAGADGIMIHSRKKSRMRFWNSVINSGQRIRRHLSWWCRLPLTALRKTNWPPTASIS